MLTYFNSYIIENINLKEITARKITARKINDNKMRKMFEKSYPKAPALFTALICPDPDTSYPNALPCILRH